MSRPPRIFVGTLYAGEAEFSECEQAIKNQKDVEVSHFVIRDLPEYEAHNALWKKWNEVRANFDLFVKVDADTILESENTLSKIAKLFESRPDVTGAQIRLFDYFTNGLISGLNCFSNKVWFEPSGDALFADHADRGHEVVLRGEAVKCLEPIGTHCRNPSDVQAFHFGYHRALKKQNEVLKLVAKNYLEFRDKPRMWALAGAQIGFKEANFVRKLFGRWFKENANYGNKRFAAKFSELNKKDDLAPEVERFCRALLEP